MASSNNRVVLINTNRMQPVVAPIALDYLSTFLQSHGYDVALLDLALVQDHLKSVEGHLKGVDPLAIGVTVRNTDDCYFASRDFFLPEIRRVVGSIKERTNAPVVLGGCGFSIMPAAVLDYCGCELGIRGDGEVAFLQLLDALRHGSGYTGWTGGGASIPPPTCPWNGFNPSGVTSWTTCVISLRGGWATSRPNAAATGNAYIAPIR